MSREFQLRTIVVPIDFSPCSTTALDFATMLAKTAGPAHIILAHAYFVPVELESLVKQHTEPMLETLTQEADKALEKLLIGLQDQGIAAEFTVMRGYPEKAIVELARDKNADLIVMGTHGRTGLAHIALGSIAERIVRTAHCPVITVRQDLSKNRPASPTR